MEGTLNIIKFYFPCHGHHLRIQLNIGISVLEGQHKTVPKVMIETEVLNDCFGLILWEESLSIAWVFWSPFSFSVIAMFKMTNSFNCEVFPLTFFTVLTKLLFMHSGSETIYCAWKKGWKAQCRVLKMPLYLFWYSNKL